MQEQVDVEVLVFLVVNFKLSFPGGLVVALVDPSDNVFDGVVSKVVELEVVAGRALLLHLVVLLRSV